MGTCIRITNLHKEYKKSVYHSERKVLRGVCVEIKKGEIYGLIGRNGTGKTTLLKCIAGLVVPTSGRVQIYEEDDEKNLCVIRKKMGALINKPALDPDMSAWDNMKIAAIRKGLSDNDIIDALTLVGLYDKSALQIHDQVKTFSTGMRQRLGIAMAIMGKPEMIILDEPLNGLDPDGVFEIHELIRKLNCNGATILISSHLLRELDQIATKYGILKNGKIISEVTSKELQDRGQSLEDYYRAITKA